MKPDEQKALDELRTRLLALSKKKRRFIQMLMDDPERWWTRKELAYRLARPRNLLLRHDIQTLNWLEENYWIDARKDRIMDELLRRGQPATRSTQGRGIVMRSQFWSYQIAGHIANDLERLYSQVGVTRQSPAPKPVRVFYSSPLARLKDKLGL